MHTIIHPLKASKLSRLNVTSASFRNPHYDCSQQADALKLVVYVPGVEAAGVEITLRGPDLVVTARKSHFVRVNWSALHLETAQRDYQLSLRVGNGFDHDAMSAEIAEGVLTVILPHKINAVVRHRRVA
jgi:HSP20 family molecular chaperone IbpA